MFAQAGLKPAGTSRSLSHDAAAADAARAQAAISRPPTHQARAPVPNAAGPAERGVCGPRRDDGSFRRRRDHERLPKALPQPTHIIDWFHIAMKIQPLQQIADHVVR